MLDVKIGIAIKNTWITHHIILVKLHELWHLQPYLAWAQPAAYNETEEALNVGVSIIQKYEDFFNIEFPLPKQGTTLSRLLYYWSRSYLSGLPKIPYFMQLFNYVIPQFCIKLRGYKIVNTNFFRLIYICPKIKNKFLKSTKCDSTGLTQVLIIVIGFHFH